MTKNKFKKGDLVFIPSSVRLIQFSEQNKIYNELPLFVNKHTTTNEPRHVLLIEDSLDKYCKVYYNGECWFADTSDVYEGTL